MRQKSKDVVISQFQARSHKIKQLKRVILRRIFTPKMESLSLCPRARSAHTSSEVGPSERPSQQADLRQNTSS
ncbi:hypothetical protein PhaeoP75_04402 (plasmid) [Phaeobacter gallaeciensis]|uniref:Uncharacterized protein n=1 Tax=Phaeobacter gallaeciensis TaxID=60890 RepID=A0AAC9ZDN0_9RHOB|nr:hypothetical protein Gal_04409 [Phaeobacter gallaeciensis DSM 26640]ATE95297.1 hypothetical protein PhaeoP11_04313 [Phaeobacter gallaeciensis]ATE99687.1 hypothetical protein PhaeoP73_04428 [Phaeobacter gallaeciensis]ATF04001.1 hypothetical protein PhaeoP75_04402 [Phaeobacter gallaeciensis]ATF08277.1 hypothetical protein PhaeoP63_04247 [Phaeobacter gallaeciensis]